MSVGDSELVADNPRMQRCTREWLKTVNGVGDSKARSIADQAPQVADLAELIEDGRIGQFVGGVITERIRIDLAKFLSDQKSRTVDSVPLDHEAFMLDKVQPWLSKKGMKAIGCQRKVPLTVAGVTVEIDLLTTDSKEQPVVVLIRQHIDQREFIDAMGVLHMARDKDIAERYIILSSRGTACCEAGVTKSGVEVHLLD